jgi:tRNA G10  N-methylase Trm11
MAIGPAGTRGAPSQTLRRTHRGTLKEYALKSRLFGGVTAGSIDRSNISTAMEPEIGFLMANLALAGTDAGQSVIDPCCGSGSLLLYASALGATHLVGVDSDSSVWESAQDEFKRHTIGIGKNNSNVQLSIPTFFHGDVLHPSLSECLHTANSFDAIVCDPPYNIGAPVLLAGQDMRPINHHHNDEEEGKSDRGETINAQYDDAIPSIVAIARRILVDGGRLIFFLPVRGEEMQMTLKQLLLKKGWQMSGSDEQLEIQFGRLQRFTPTFARWLVCMTKSSVNDLQ